MAGELNIHSNTGIPAQPINLDPKAGSPMVVDSNLPATPNMQPQTPNMSAHSVAYFSNADTVLNDVDQFMQGSVNQQLITTKTTVSEIQENENESTAQLEQQLKKDEQITKQTESKAFETARAVLGKIGKAGAYFLGGVLGILGGTACLLAAGIGALIHLPTLLISKITEKYVSHKLEEIESQKVSLVKEQIELQKEINKFESKIDNNETIKENRISLETNIKGINEQYDNDPIHEQIKELNNQLKKERENGGIAFEASVKEGYPQIVEEYKKNYPNSALSFTLMGPLIEGKYYNMLNEIESKFADQLESLTTNRDNIKKECDKKISEYKLIYNNKRNEIIKSDNNMRNKFQENQLLKEKIAKIESQMKSLKKRADITNKIDLPFAILATVITAPLSILGIALLAPVRDLLDLGPTSDSKTAREVLKAPLEILGHALNAEGIEGAIAMRCRPAV